MTPAPAASETAGAVDFCAETRCAAGHTSTARIIGYDAATATAFLAAIQSQRCCTCGARAWHSFQSRPLDAHDARQRSTLPAPPPPKRTPSGGFSLDVARVEGDLDRLMESIDDLDGALSPTTLSATTLSDAPELPTTLDAPAAPELADFGQVDLGPAVDDDGRR